MRDERTEDRRLLLPLDGVAETPEEINAYLSRYSLGLEYRDIMNLSTIEQSANQSQENQKNLHAQIDDLLSKELLGMSLKDRNAVYEEIHGVQTISPEESPESLQSSLEELESAIELIPPDSKKAFLRAKNIAPYSYINGDDFRLRFLRCEMFDATKAATRMTQFLELYTDLFGDVALKRPIKLSDFSREEMQAFRVGHFQLLPFRDRSGRRVFVNVGGFGLAINLRTRVKILFYLMLVASDDVESQRRGLISIVWPGTKYPVKSENENTVKLDRVIFMKRVYANLPIRTIGIHFCFPKAPFFDVVRPLFILSMPDYLNRMKFHIGESVEQRYRLKGFGIPVELIPLTDTGNIKTTYLKQWMKLRKTVEDRAAASSESSIAGSSTGSSANSSEVTSDGEIIECPGTNDVIFRSGTALLCHPGNPRFRWMVESKLASNIQSTQAVIASQLIEEIEAKGGRFLKWNYQCQCWTEVEDRVQVHHKVAMSIRDYKYKSKCRENRQENQSYTYMFCQEGKRKRDEPDAVESNYIRRFFQSPFPSTG